jgi:hypothetical protein
VFGAAGRERDAASGPVVPIVTTGTMQACRDRPSDQVACGARGLPVMDRAGWHGANLVVPDDSTPFLLPPYSPELHAIERLLLDLEERSLSHRRRTDDDAVCQARLSVTNEIGRTRSFCSMAWAWAVNK